MTVHFIGAGPGAADLITVRGARTLARCGVCLYAGSLVPPELLAECPPDARLVDTARLDLDQITAEFVRAHEAGQDVARLHSGDPAVFSAVAEQMRRLDAVGIPYEIVPGVPAFAAAAAALGRELTVPTVGQTVILTRIARQATPPCPPARTSPRSAAAAPCSSSTSPPATPTRSWPNSSRTTAPTARRPSSPWPAAPTRSCCAAPSPTSRTR
ncbi:hypothetical protein GCM10020000_11550 [Streptomyces olivoverticillatus]